MKGLMVFLLGMSVVLCHGTMAAASGINYFNDFEQYAIHSGIDGVDGWTSHSPTYAGTSCWRVLNASDSGGLPGITYGNYLERGAWWSAEGEDYATLHLTSSQALNSLNIRFNYLLDGNELHFLRKRP